MKRPVMIFSVLLLVMTGIGATMLRCTKISWDLRTVKAWCYEKSPGEAPSVEEYIQPTSTEIPDTQTPTAIPIIESATPTPTMTTQPYPGPETPIGVATATQGPYPEIGQ